LIKLSGGWPFGRFTIQFLLDTVVYFALVGLLWYVVSIEAGGKGLSVLAPRMGSRRVADVFGMAFGGAVAGMGLLMLRHEFGFVTPYSTFVAAPYFIWAAVIAGFYGHDLWACLRTRPVRPADSGGPC
jgi:hypothetical protein